ACFTRRIATRSHSPTQQAAWFVLIRSATALAYAWGGPYGSHPRLVWSARGPHRTHCGVDPRHAVRARQSGRRGRSGPDWSEPGALRRRHHSGLGAWWQLPASHPILVARERLSI